MACLSLGDPAEPTPSTSVAADQNGGAVEPLTQILPAAVVLIGGIHAANIKGAEKVHHAILIVRGCSLDALSLSELGPRR